MTKAEAKAMLKRIQEPETWEPQINQAAFEALDMAIEALSQESSEDVISRQAALDAMETWDKFGCDPDGKLVRYDDDKHYIPYVHYEDMAHVIKHLPSAQPEQRWIPCSEELPKENGHYLVTFHQTATEEDLGFDMDDTDVCKMRYDTKHGWRTPRHIPSWINDVVVSTVLAWMPLPEPYREERTEE